MDAVIVDSVLAIRKGLTEHQGKGETPVSSPHSLVSQRNITVLNGKGNPSDQRDQSPDKLDLSVSADLSN